MTTVQVSSTFTTVTASDGIVSGNNIIGAYGSSAVSNMFRDAIAGDDSLDMFVVGDSNTLFYSGGSSTAVSGWTDGFTSAIYKIGSPIYATPIFPLYLDASTQTQGWRCLWSAFAGGLGGNGTTGDDGVTTAYMLSGNLGSSLAGGAPVLGPTFCTNAFTASIGFGPAGNQMLASQTSFDYPWYPAGAANRFQDYIAGIEISADHPMGITSALNYRIVHAVFQTSGGEFWVACQDNAGNPLIADQQVSCGSTSDSIITTTVALVANPARTLPIQWRWAGKFGLRTTRGINGKFAGFLQSVSRNIKGFSASAMCWYSGATMTQISTGASAVGITDSLKTWLREARTRQIACGGSGRVVVLIHGGANTDTGLPDSWTTASNNIISRFTTAWSSLGYPASQLGFLAMVSHVKSNPDDLSTVRTFVDTAYASSSNVLAVNLGIAAPVSKMSNLTYYDAGGGNGDGTPDVHLSPLGYENVAQMALERILTHNLS